MKRMRHVWMLALLVSGSALLATNFAEGATPFSEGSQPRGEAEKCPDVTLAPGNVLWGQVQTSQAAPLGNADLVVTQAGREVARTATDAQGNFQISGIRGGTYTLATAGSATTIRVWTANAAPPSAQHGVLLVERGDVVRGQGAGGTFWRTVTNPWVSAGVITAAIAVPIALNNNDSGS